MRDFLKHLVRVMNLRVSREMRVRHWRILRREGWETVFLTSPFWHLCAVSLLNRRIWRLIKMCVVDIDRTFDFFCLWSVSGLTAGLTRRVKSGCAASMKIISPILSVLLTEILTWCILEKPNTIFWWSCLQQEVKSYSLHVVWFLLFSSPQQNLRHWPSPPRLLQQKMVPLGDHWTWRTTKRDGGLFEHAHSAASDPACSMMMSYFFFLPFQFSLLGWSSNGAGKRLFKTASHL